MTTQFVKSLAVVAAALLASRAAAHEVDCEKTVGVVQVDAQGNPVLGPDGPVFVGSAAATITINQYPAVIGWRIRVNNLAAETSFIAGFSDPFLASSTSVVFGTLPAPGLGIPVGGATDAVVLQRIGSYEECVGQPPPANLAALSMVNETPAHGQVCRRDGVVNHATVVTESNVAQCRAKVICEPDPDRGLPPSCHRVNGLIWCFNPELCGTGCAAVCASLGFEQALSDADWFNAQNTQAKCDAISTAFGVPTPSQVGGFTLGCIEDALAPHEGNLVGPLLCSTSPTCPSLHRLAADNPDRTCAAGSSRMSLCPCTIVPP